MKHQIKKLNQGFTIIEVMIVLAIAGLIMAIVFIAVPQLQRNQRDNARQDIANRLKAELETYAGNNQGLYPFAAVPATVNGTSCNGQAVVAGTKNCADWFTRYICTAIPYANPCAVANVKVKMVDPGTGTDVVLNYTNSVAAKTWVAGQAWLGVGAVCNGESLAAGSGAGNANSKQYAILMSLDRSNTYYCIDNG
jgi:prepilin-type N-terminal cleavage/methylation domain-containing protein